MWLFFSKNMQILSYFELCVINKIEIFLRSVGDEQIKYKTKTTIKFITDIGNIILSTFNFSFNIVTFVSLDFYLYSFFFSPFSSASLELLALVVASFFDNNSFRLSSPSSTGHP